MSRFSRSFSAAKPNLRAIAAEIEKVAKELPAEAEKYKKDEDYKDMLKMFQSDARSMMKVAAFVRDGKLEQARNAAFNMDTAARDELPNSFWKLVDQDDEDQFSASAKPIRAAPFLAGAARFAAFNKGDKVRSDTTAQGMKKGEIYSVTDLDQQSTPFGMFVYYELTGPDGRKFWVSNLHLLGSKV